MIRIQLGTAQDDLVVIWPKSEADILALGATFIAYESTRALGDRLKDISLEVIQAVWNEAKTAADTAWGGEAFRAEASETYRQNYAQAIPLLNLAISHLKAKYHANLAQLESWGLKSVVRANRVSVQKPRTQKNWIAFLRAYVTRELALAPEDRLTVPDLGHMQTLDQAIQSALVERTAGRNQREIHTAKRGVGAPRLLDLLQIAAITIVALLFDGVVTNELQRWGFKVQARPAPKITEEETEVLVAEGDGSSAVE